MLNSVILAIEDVLSEVISTKILKNFGVEITTIIRDSGNVYLRQKASEFVRDYWNLERAATVSPSLKRTLDRLNQATETGAPSEQKIPAPH